MASLELFTLSLLAVVLISHQAVPISADVPTSIEYGVTDVQPERIVYDWTIRNFNLLPHGPEQHINSTAFGTKNKDRKWKLQLYPGGVDASPSEYVSIYLMSHSLKPIPGNMNVNIQCRLSWMTPSTGRQSGPAWQQPFASVLENGFKKFIKRSDLLGYGGSASQLLQIRAEINVEPRIITITPKD